VSRFADIPAEPGSELLESYRDVAIAEVQLQADLDLVANDHTVDIQKAEIYAQTEIEVTQMDAQDVIFEATTAGMTEEQKAEYIKQLREMNMNISQSSYKFSCVPLMMIFKGDKYNLFCRQSQ